MNDAVIQDVHFGTKPRAADPPTFTDQDFGELVNPNIVQEPPKVITLPPFVITHCWSDC